MWNYSRWKNSYIFKQYEYNLIYDIYNNIRNDSRVIFMVRHAERWPDDSHIWWLVENGIRQAKSLWKKLTGWRFTDTNSDFYWSTDYKRTHQTSYYVWYGRWYSPFHEDKKIFKKEWMQYNKVLNPIDVISPHYLTQNNLTQNIELKKINKKSVYVINTLCKLTEWHPFSFIVDHDSFLIPMITRVTEWNIKFTRKTWINYLSWVAIIIDDKAKKWEIYPINTLKKKSMELVD